MKRKLRRMPAYSADVIFLPAITPLEAAVLPAQEKPVYGTLGMIRYAHDAGSECAGRFGGAQRAKIWVR